MISRIVARARSLWRGLHRRSDVEAEMNEELRLHIELRTEDLLQTGISPAEAARQARCEFGSVARYMDEARVSRGLHRVDALRFSWLDFKLGFRMLARYPGLTVVGGLAMAFAIFIGAGTFEYLRQMLHPTLPFPDEDRIVGLRYWDRVDNERELPLPYDLHIWRDELSAVEQLGGFQTVHLNLAVGEEAGEPVQVVEVSSIGFRMMRVPPLLGRPLVESDESPGAAPVVVLGHDVWQTRFAGDSAVVGRTVRLGETRATIVGVMPDGFSISGGSHSVWAPLRLEPFHGDVDSGTPMHVFGRIAPGATLEKAQAEATALAARLGGEAPERYEHLTAEVLPYAESLLSVRFGLAMRAIIYHLNMYPALFLILVSANVALLMFARAATREREIVVRNALGASRGRIVMQLFIEALVLGALAAVLGLAATGPVLRRIDGEFREIVGGSLFGFGVQPGVSATTIGYAVVLTLLGAVVAGVIPALKTTGRGMQARLRQVAAGAGGVRLGGIWTGVIVGQIAATVVFGGVAFVVARQAMRNATVEPYFPAEQYLGFQLQMDRGDPMPGADTTDDGFQRRYASLLRELQRRIASDPAVAGVTVVDRPPVTARGFGNIVLEKKGATPLDTGPRGRRVRSDAVDLNFFDVFRTPVLAGRGFDSRDLADGVNAVIVNASFVDEVLGGRSAIGQRVRYAQRDPSREPGPWYEIVGVVQDLVADQMRALSGFEDPPKARMYHPLNPSRAGSYALHVIAYVPGGPENLIPTLYGTAEAVSPALRLHGIQTLDRIDGDIELIWRLFAFVILLVSGAALFLSLAGTYAVVSFTVARRTREIGIRVALGAKPPRVIAEIFAKPLVRVGAGVLMGCMVMGVLMWSFTDGRMTVGHGALLLVLGAGMLTVSALACIGPTLRALRVEPTEALRNDG